MLLADRWSGVRGATVCPLTLAGTSDRRSCWMVAFVHACEPCARPPLAFSPLPAARPGVRQSGADTRA